MKEVQQRIQLHKESLQGNQEDNRLQHFIGMFWEIF